GFGDVARRAVGQRAGDPPADCLARGADALGGAVREVGGQRRELGRAAEEVELGGQGRHLLRAHAGGPGERGELRGLEGGGTTQQVGTQRGHVGGTDLGGTAQQV